MRTCRSIGSRCLVLAAVAMAGPALGLEPAPVGADGEGVGASPAVAFADAPKPITSSLTLGSERSRGIDAVDGGISKPPGVSPPSRAVILPMVDRVADRHGLDRDLVHALIRAESAYDAHAVSRVGALGLMQVMPTTAADYGVASVDALFDPAINLDTGMRHLKRLLARYGSIGPAVMAYNAGEGALERSAGFVTYPETQRYTHAVLVAYIRKKGIQPYTAQAHELVGMDVTPAMANASVAGGGRSGRSADSEAGEVPATETQERAPATRLTSRLSPSLSRRSEAEATARAPRPAASQGVLERNRMRFAGQTR
jgi:hypothetical protein